MKTQKKNKITPFIIAEIGSNFDQKLNKAKKMITVAKKCGADAVKFQLFNPNKLYPLKKDIKIRSIFKKIRLKKNMIPLLIQHAKKENIEIFFSVFDLQNLKFLEKFDLKYYKIASSEVTNLSLVKKIADTGKTLLISTGMSDSTDIKNLHEKIKKNKNKKILMQCTSLYPANESTSNLNVLKYFKKKYPSYILGFSDHTKSDISAIIAVGLGATYFEKHFTLNKKSKGPDHFFAYNPKQFRKYVKSIKLAFSAMGSYNKNFLPEEKKISRRQGLYSKRKILKGEIINKKNTFSCSPALGIRYRDAKKYFNKYKTNKLINIQKPIFIKDITK